MFENYKLYEPRLNKREDRYYITIRELGTGKLRTMAYARFLMINSLNRELDPSETVDHINNNRLDDRVENLQLLSFKDNIKKYWDLEENKEKVYSLVCPECGKNFTLTSSKLSARKNNKLTFCSRSCNGKHYYKNNFINQ